MYFKVSLRHNPVKGKTDGYYRLIESYRNETGRVCHRTLLNVGFIEEMVDIDQLNQIRRILCNRYEEALGNKRLFEIEDNPPIVNQLADEYWNKLVAENRIDIGQKKPTVHQRNMVSVESIRHKDVREIGGEWLCYQALEQLQIKDYLSNIGFSEEDVQLALTQIISRAVYPASELETSRWIVENSAVCELTGYPLEKITKDKLYKSSLRLFSVKDQIEQYLSHKTNQLFDIEDKLYIYDLTNTYFEGQKKHSLLARYGRSKEKRSDCKIVVLAMVVNPQGFIKYSTIFEGNIQDCSTLKMIVENLRKKTSASAKKAIVVIDAGIATEENLAMLTAEGFDYICVSRCKLKDYRIDPTGESLEIEDKKHQKIKLQKVISDRHDGYFLKIDSQAKRQKEMSMNNRFQEGFEKGMNSITASLEKKSGIKMEEKVYERVGRLKQKYPSISAFYDIKYVVETTTVTNRKTKEKKEVRQVKSINWNIKENVDLNSRSGVYFLRTSLQETEMILWEGYNTIREIEDDFRTLKTDLDLRPIYHKRDDSTMAHLHLGLLAYWVVNTVRFQLKCNQETTSINFRWKEIIRIMNTQKAVTTIAQNNYDEVIIIRRCNDTNQKVQAIYDKLKYKTQPFSKRKFVVHKSEFLKSELFDYKHFPT